MQTGSRRDFLKTAGAACVISARAESKADYTIRIAATPIEIAPKKIISMVTYNGQFPGPLLRFEEGREVTVDVINETDTAEQLHWHGQMVSPEVDGAAEEGTPHIPARGSRRIAFMPRPAGLRFYHTHNRAGANLSAGQYSGQVGPVYIEPKENSGRYDREIFLTLKEFEPTFSRGGDMAQDMLSPATKVKELETRGESAMKASLAKGMPHGFEVGYDSFTINGKMLFHGEPVRVKQGERVLFHVLNGSATEIRSLALPGHSFEVVALDGNPVPKSARVPVLWLGTAERISAVVEMNHPGVWILGDTADDDRHHGMGVVVEYANRTGRPQWITPAHSKDNAQDGRGVRRSAERASEIFSSVAARSRALCALKWNYTQFAGPSQKAPAPDETFDMVFTKQNAAEDGFNVWQINGIAYPMGGETKPSFHLKEGKRYRLRMRNASDDVHPVHLHRHSFEITNYAGIETAGIMKDVVMVGGYQEVHVDFVANNPGLTLFHCHQQLHMDYGFMSLFDYA